jgi:hypothetical protein
MGNFESARNCKKVKLGIGDPAGLGIEARIRENLRNSRIAL